MLSAIVRKPIPKKDYVQASYVYRKTPTRTTCPLFWGNESFPRASTISYQTAFYCFI
jgi:hypothetical protein